MVVPIDLRNFCGFFTESYVYPELRFEFDFLSDPWTYYKVIIQYILWSIGWFFLFWKPNYVYQKTKAQSKTEK
jgi:hypothetical protein